MARQARAPLGKTGRRHLVATRARACLASPTRTYRRNLLESLLVRHVTGDWGDVSADQRRANEEAVREGGRILSAYGDGKLRVYVITESDRSATTIISSGELP